MSIAEFFIENGMDPTDPRQWQEFLDSHSGRAQLARYKYGSSGISEEQRHEAKTYVLNQSELDYMAETRGWETLDASSSEAPMASYRKDGTRLNFWLTTGTVGSYLDHPSQGKTQLFRRQINMSQASDLFQNPRQHTGAGYHTNKKKEVPMKKQQHHKQQQQASTVQLRRCAGCHADKHATDFSKNQRRKGSSAKCRSCVDG